MTVSSSINRVVQTGNGATTVWNYSFLIPDASEVVVQITDKTTGVVTTLTTLQYSITGIGNPSGGTVTYTPALTTNQTITIQRILPVTQGTSLSNQGAFYPTVIETALDYLTMVCQQLNDATGRALVISPNGVGTIDAQTNRIINVVNAVNAQDVVTLAQLQAQFAASGNVPSPTLGQVGQYLKATATGVWAWAVAQVTSANITDSTAVGRAFLTATNALAQFDLLGANFASVASAGTVSLGSQSSQNITITGTTTITSFGTAAAGVLRTVKFAAALTLTYNATSLILPGGVNITTAANDTAVFQSLGSGNWICLSYTRANGGPIATLGGGLSLSAGVMNSMMVKLASGTASSVATLDLTLTSGYRAFKLLFRNLLPATNSVNLAIRVSLDSGATYKAGATDYNYQGDSINTGSVRAGYAGSSTAMFIASGSISSSVTLSGGEMLINPGNASYRATILGMTIYHDGTNAYAHYYTGNYAVNGTITNLRVLMSTGNIANMEYDLYGLL